MCEVILVDSVAQRGRLSIDVSDLREDIESCRTDVAWQELPLSAKIRVLLRERLDQLKGRSSSEEKK